MEMQVDDKNRALILSLAEEAISLAQTSNPYSYVSDLRSCLHMLSKGAVIDGRVHDQLMASFWSSTSAPGMTVAPVAEFGVPQREDFALFLCNELFRISPAVALEECCALIVCNPPHFQRGFALRVSGAIFDTLRVAQDAPLPPFSPQLLSLTEKLMSEQEVSKYGGYQSYGTLLASLVSACVLESVLKENPSLSEIEALSAVVDACRTRLSAVPQATTFFIRYMRDDIEQMRLAGFNTAILERFNDSLRRIG
jgi:hypothetical protein